MTQSHMATSADTDAHPVVQLIATFVAFLSSLPEWIVAVAARVGVAGVFWTSARLKVDGFSIKDSTYFLFEHEYALPLIPSDWAAVLGTIAEHVFPIMLILGLGTRFGALGLLVMTAVIQTFVYPGAWNLQLLWAVGMLYLIIRGPGVLSLDHLIAKRYAR
ncbi:MAG: DoxX family protein [Candidatus Phaeomarinobacter sp.]